MIDREYLEFDNRLNYKYFVAQISIDPTNPEFRHQSMLVYDRDLPYFLPMLRSQYYDIVRPHEPTNLLVGNLVGAWRSRARGDEWGISFECEEDAVFVSLLASGGA